MRCTLPTPDLTAQQATGYTQLCAACEAGCCGCALKLRCCLPRVPTRRLSLNATGCSSELPTLAAVRPSPITTTGEQGALGMGCNECTMLTQDAHKETVIESHWLQLRAPNPSS